MKNKLAYTLILTGLALVLTAASVEAKATVVGDIILQGKVERSGQPLLSDTSVFEGDSIRTEKGSGGVLRIAHGRLEIGESSEVEIVRQNPLRLVVKSGTIAFNFPPETALEIVTPQLEVHPNLGEKALSGIISATPKTEDRVQSRSGNFTVIERQKNGEANHIVPGQIVIATLLPSVRLSTAAAEPISPEPQGPPGGPAIATLDQTQGDVRVARLAMPNNYARVAEGSPRLPLASGDFVRTLNGKAKVNFAAPDTSTLTLSEGTTIRIQQQMQANTISRRVTQAIGNLYFSIQRITGTQTTLETPTAVAAIRGTEGTQEVPNDTQSTHALNEGIEQITERVTSQFVTIRSGQRVTAIRGVGFTPIVALLAAIAQPVVGAGGAGGGGGGAGAGGGGGAAGGGAGGGAAGGGAGGAAGGGAAGGGAAGGAAGAATGAATSAATAATVSTVSTVASVAATAAASATAVATAAIVPVVASSGTTTSASSSTPIALNPPGGG